MTPRYTLADDGYFRRDGARFIPVGVNWWPASCGVELWQKWPDAEIQHDLDVVAGLGLNCIRFFLRWQDFEPRPGEYDVLSFERLDRLLGWFAERDLAAHPSLFVGFMSGGVFWPEWRAGRNLFADPFMRERSVAFARAATRVIVSHSRTVVAIDQGNELCCLSDSREAPPAAVRGWCADVNSAIREIWPEATIISGNEQNQINSDNGWRLDGQPGCDLLSMHAYPVPGWHSIGFDGMTDPLCQSLLPFYTRVARAYAPVMVQEFGTIVTFGEHQQATYLGAILPGCWASGANGFLWWCLRDIVGTIHPYVSNGFEGSLGLIDADDAVKPGLEGYLTFCRELAERPAPAAVPGNVGVAAADSIALYWPKLWWSRDTPGAAGKETWSSSRRLVIANHLLRVAGHDPAIVRGDLPLPTPGEGGPTTLVVSSMNLRVDEAEALTRWVEAGGRLLWHGVDPVNWGPAYIHLLGAVPVDYRAVAGPRRTQFVGETWDFNSFPRNMRCDVVARDAEVLLADQDGNPLAIRHRLGRGVVVAAFPAVEEAAAGVADRPALRDRWAKWYVAMLTALRAD